MQVVESTLYKSKQCIKDYWIQDDIGNFGCKQNRAISKISIPSKAND